MENQIGPNEGRKAAKTTPWVILAVVALIVIAAALYFGGVFDTNTNSSANTAGNTNAETNTNVAGTTNTTSNTNFAFDTANWRTYTSSTFDFSFKYPAEWRVFENDDQIAIYKGANMDDGFGLYIIPGTLQDVVASINNIQTLQAGDTISTHANGVPAYVINITQIGVNQTYTELAIDLSNGYFIRLTPYELNPTTGFPSVPENQEVIFGAVNSFTQP